MLPTQAHQVAYTMLDMLASAILSGLITWSIMSYVYRREAARIHKECLDAAERENVKLWKEHGFEMRDGKPVYVGRWSKEWIEQQRQNAKGRQIGEGHGTGTVGDPSRP
jgi:hypothetical protein